MPSTASTDDLRPLGHLVRREQVDRVRAHEALSFWHASLRRLAAGILATRVPPGASLLDVGCGTGFAVDAVGRAIGAVSAVGMDYDGYALHGAVRPVVRGSATAIPFQDASFDCVQSFSVLDHIPPPLIPGVLFEVLRVLRPGGTFVLEIPAFPWLMSAHDRTSNAIQRFTLHPLQAQCKAAGFDVVLATYWVFHLFPAVAVSRLLSRANVERPGALRTDVGRLGAAVELILSAVMRFEEFLVLRCGIRFRWGLNLVLVLRRPSAHLAQDGPRE